MYAVVNNITKSKDTTGISIPEFAYFGKHIKDKVPNGSHVDQYAQNMRFCGDYLTGREQNAKGVALRELIGRIWHGNSQLLLDQCIGSFAGTNQNNGSLEIKEIPAFFYKLLYLSVEQTIRDLVYLNIPIPSGMYNLRAAFPNHVEVTEEICPKHYIQSYLMAKK